MPAGVVLESLAAKQEVLQYLETSFAGWVSTNREENNQIAHLWQTEEAADRARQHLIEVTREAEIFAVDPVMSNVVKMAAEDLPPEASFVPDDLPTELGLLYLGDPLPLPVGDPETVAGLDTIVWHGAPVGVILAGWATISSLRHAFPTHRVPVAVGRFDYQERMLGLINEDGIDRGMVEALSVALTHTLAALRIMQQPYAGRLRERAPRSAARRLARLSARSDITVISYRRTGTETPTDTDTEVGRQLDHRVLVRGHWRHQRYKTPDGAWSAKLIYIGPYIRGPEDGPLIVTQKVNDLHR